MTSALHALYLLHLLPNTFKCLVYTASNDLWSRTTQEMKESGHGTMWNTILAFALMGQWKLLKTCHDISTLHWGLNPGHPNVKQGSCSLKCDVLSLSLCSTENTTAQVNGWPQSITKLPALPKIYTHPSSSCQWYCSWTIRNYQNQVNCQYSCFKNFYKSGQKSHSFVFSFMCNRSFCSMDLTKWQHQKDVSARGL